MDLPTNHMLKPVGQKRHVLVINVRGGLQLHGGSLQWQPPAPRSSNTSVHCILVSELSRKVRHSQTMDGTTLHSHWEEAEQNKYQEYVLVPTVSTSFGQLRPGIALWAFFLWFSWKTPIPHPLAVINTKCCGWARWSSTYWIWNRERYSTQGDQPETGCAGSLALSEELLEVEGTFLLGCVVAHGLSFPTEPLFPTWLLGDWTFI